MTGIVDYGVGNLFSLRSSLRAIGAEAVVSGDRDVLSLCDRIILPGVGAFPDAARKLTEGGLDEFLKKEAEGGKPLLGICLGMQLLLEYSTEYGRTRGLGLCRGGVTPIADEIEEGLKIPHIGWNALHFTGEKHPLFRYLKEGDFVYFVHSFHASPRTCPDVIATAEYGGTLTAAVARGNVMGCQFHPEKSGDTGLSILRAFVEGEGVAV